MRFSILRRGFALKRASIRRELSPSYDWKEIFRNRDVHLRNIANRQLKHVDMSRLERLYWEYCQLKGSLQQQQQLRKRLAKDFAKAIDMADAADAVDDAHFVREKVEELKGRLRVVEEELGREGMLLPNLSHPDSPIGDAGQSLIVEEFGQTALMSAMPTDHVLLGRRLGILDFEAGARATGSSFYFLRRQGALLENALVQYAMKMALQSGFSPILPPDIVNSKFIRACGFFPRSEEPTDALPVYTAEVDNARSEDGSAELKVLAATGEIPLAAYYHEQVIPEAQLPVKWVALSHCFRPETGHYGAESRGLYRVHQFTKVELFVLKDNDPVSSDLVLEEIVNLQKRILTGLNLHCRLLNMSTAELGASAHQKYDIEAYFPCRAGWGELTSASNCTDYQSRRMQLKYRPTDQSALRFAHTLNGTACAIPRVIQAIMENHQRPDGSIVIPEVLHPFMLDGSKIITDS